MSDVHSPQIRSKNMRAIRSANTKPELIVRKALHAAGYRYRLGGEGLPGRPDLVLPRYRTVIFVHGCFWHGHNCRYFKIPQTRREFWMSKIESNQARDTASVAKLNELGWHVIVIWECATKADGPGVQNMVRRVQTDLSARSPLIAPSQMVIVA